MVGNHVTFTGMNWHEQTDLTQQALLLALLLSPVMRANSHAWFVPPSLTTMLYIVSLNRSRRRR